MSSLFSVCFPHPLDVPIWISLEYARRGFFVGGFSRTRLSPSGDASYIVAVYHYGEQRGDFCATARFDLLAHLRQSLADQIELNLLVGLKAKSR
jgi:hypothetical protein